MSNLVLSRDPRTSIVSDSNLHTLVDVGGQRVSYSVNQATSASYTDTSVSSASWTINPPSNQTIVSREVLVRYYLRVTLDQPLAELRDCLRQFPMSSITESCQVKINGSAVSTKQVGDLIHAEQCFYNESEDRRKAFMSPSYPDQFGTLIAGANRNRNPAGSYGDNVSEPSRDWPYEDQGNNVYHFVVSEPLFISPFLDAVGEPQQGMINVNELYVQLIYKTMVDRVMTCMPRAVGPQVTSVQVGFYQPPELLLCYITPNMLDYIEPVQTLPYVNPVFNRNSQTGGGFARDEERQLNSQYYRLGEIPKYCLIYACPKDDGANYNFATANGFAEIVSINVQWNNENSLLINATQQDLYQISRRNGLNMSWAQWKTHRGGPVMLEFGRDIGLPDGLSPSTVGSFTLNIRTTFKNTALAQDVELDYNIVFYQQGTFVVSQNSGRTSEGLLTPALVLAAEKSESVEHHAHPAHVHGAGLLHRLSGVVPIKKKPMEMSMAMAAPAPAPTPMKIGGSLRR